MAKEELCSINHLLSRVRGASPTTVHGAMQRCGYTLEACSQVGRAYHTSYTIRAHPVCVLLRVSFLDNVVANVVAHRSVTLPTKTDNQNSDLSDFVTTIVKTGQWVMRQAYRGTDTDSVQAYNRAVGFIQLICFENCETFGWYPDIVLKILWDVVRGVYLNIPYDVFECRLNSLEASLEAAKPYIRVHKI